MKYIITAALSAWITYTLITADFDCRVDREYTRGYVEWQEGEYLPKTEHKQPDCRLKEKEVG